MPLNASDQAQLNSLGATQQEAVQFETQLAQMQMKFETELDAAKAQKDAATAIQSQG